MRYALTDDEFYVWSMLERRVYAIERYINFAAWVARWCELTGEETSP